MSDSEEQFCSHHGLSCLEFVDLKGIQKRLEILVLST